MDKIVCLVGVEGELAGVACLGMQKYRSALGENGVSGAVGDQQMAWADGGDRVTGAGVGREAGDSGDERALRACGDGDSSAEVPADEGYTFDSLAPQGVERAKDAVTAVSEGARVAIAQLGDGGDALERWSKIRVETRGASKGAITAGKKEHGGMVAAGRAPEAMNRAVRSGDGQRDRRER